METVYKDIDKIYMNIYTYTHKYISYSHITFQIFALEWRNKKLKKTNKLSQIKFKYGATKITHYKGSTNISHNFIYCYHIYMLYITIILKQGVTYLLDLICLELATLGV